MIVQTKKNQVTGQDVVVSWILLFIWLFCLSNFCPAIQPRLINVKLINQVIKMAQAALGQYSTPLLRKKTQFELTSVYFIFLQKWTYTVTGSEMRRGWKLEHRSGGKRGNGHANLPVATCVLKWSLPQSSKNLCQLGYPVLGWKCFQNSTHL